MNCFVFARLAFPLFEKNMKKFLIAATFLAGGAAQAQIQVFEAQFYGGVELGTARIENSTASLTALARSSLGGTASATQDSSVNSYRLFGGYKVHEHVDLEFGYAQTSRFGMNLSGRTGNGVAYTANASTKISGLDYSVLLRPSIASGFNNLFFRVGGHNYTADQSGSVLISGTRLNVNSSESGSGTMYGLGYDAQVAKNIKLRLSANHLNRIAGISGNSGTIYSIGVLTRF